MPTRITTVILVAWSSVAAFAQGANNKDLAGLLADDRTREGAVESIVGTDKSVVARLLAWASAPPPGVSEYGLNIALAEVFGRLKTKDAIPFLIKNISLERWPASPDTLMKTPEVIESRMPAVAALVQIGPEASKALIRRPWEGMSDEGRLAAIFVVSQVRDVPEARAVLSSVLGRANMERFWAQKGLELLDRER